MNSKAIMVTAEQTVSDFYRLKSSKNLSLTISENKSGRKSSKDAKLRSEEWFAGYQLSKIFLAQVGMNMI